MIRRVVYINLLKLLKEYIMKTFKTFMATVALTCLFVTASIAGGLSESELMDKENSLKLNVEGTHQERNFSVTAAEKAYDFFKTHYNKTGKFDLDIVFQKDVTFDGVKVFGLYKDGTIYMTSFDTEWTNTRDVLGFEMNAELYTSIVTHEIAHFLLNEFAGKKIARSGSEYVAFVCQALSLSNHYRERLLNSSIEEFRSEMQINGYTYMMSGSNIFGTKCFKHFTATNGELFEDIMKGIFDPDEAIGML
jgi:hypothetical protein